MSRIKKVTIRRFSEPRANVGIVPGGFDLVYMPDTTFQMMCTAVSIETDDGVRGDYVGGEGLMLAQMLYLAPKMIGGDAFAREFFHDAFKRALRKYDRMGIGPLDNALWDWAGKKGGTNVGQMLGAQKRRIKAYASTFHGDRDGALSTPQDYADFAERCYGMGYRGFKVHGWIDGNVEEEEATILLLGQQFRGRMDLMYDAASHLRTFADALRIGRACDKAGFYWYEDPYRDTGISQHAHRKLRQMIKTPLLIGEHVRGLEVKTDFAANEATDYVRVNPDYDLGLTGSMKVAHMAEALGLDVEVHSGGPAHRHCVAACRNANYYELGLVGPKTPCYKPTVFLDGYSDELDAIGSDGHVPVPQGPGLGVVYDWDRIEAGTRERYVFE